MALKYFKFRIQGRTLVIKTDHLALVNAIANIDGEHSPTEQNFISYIKEFSPLMIHIPGPVNIVADYLSRPQNIKPKTRSIQISLRLRKSLEM